MKEITKIIFYKLKFIESRRFIASSLSNLVNNIVEEIHKIKSIYRHNNKHCETCKIKYKDCECFLEYTNIKNDLTVYKCLYYNKNCQKSLMKT